MLHWPTETRLEAATVDNRVSFRFIVYRMNLQWPTVNISWANNYCETLDVSLIFALLFSLGEQDCRMNIDTTCYQYSARTCDRPVTNLPEAVYSSPISIYRRAHCTVAEKIELMKALIFYF